MSSVISNLLESLIDPAEKVGEFLKIDKNLLLAFCYVESAGSRYAVRLEPAYYEKKKSLMPKSYADKNKITLETEIVLQCMSWGPMQIMGYTARSIGFDDNITTLTDPYLGIFWAARFLQNLWIKQKMSIDDSISSYNQGAPRKDIKGNYLNQEYVDKIKNAQKLIQTA